MDSKENESKKKGSSLTLKILITVAIVLVLIGVAWLIYYLVDYSKGQATYKNISDEYATTNEGAWYNMIDVKFAELKQAGFSSRTKI